MHTMTYYKRRSYPSDITDAQWECIAPLISTPANSKRGRKRETDLREVINAINYRWSTGCVWRMLPHDLPSWNTIYTYFHRWEQDGTLKKLRDILLNRKQSPYIDFAPKSQSDSSVDEDYHWPVPSSRDSSHPAYVYPK